MLQDKVLIWKFNRGEKEALRHIYEKYKDDLVTPAAAMQPRSYAQSRFGKTGLIKAYKQYLKEKHYD